MANSNRWEGLESGVTVDTEEVYCDAGHSGGYPAISTCTADAGFTSSSWSAVTCTGTEVENNVKETAATLVYMYLVIFAFFLMDI